MAQRGSNLFSIDLAAVERLLGDANARLTDKVDRHLAEGRSLYTEGVSAENLKRFHAFFAATKAIRKDVATARLADGRPFADAQKTVKAWFAGREDRLKTAEVTLRRKLDAYVKDRERVQARYLAAVTRTPQDERIGSGVDGSRIVSCVPTVPERPGPEIETAWVVEGYDLAALDLNALRHHFSDLDIRRALTRHLKDHGPHGLDGVSYGRSVK